MEDPDTSDTSSAPTSPSTSEEASSVPSSPKSTDTKAFTSNLQVLLRKQENELAKHLEFKKKLEEEAIEGEDEDGESKLQNKKKETEEKERQDNDSEGESLTKIKRVRKKSTEKVVTREISEGGDNADLANTKTSENMENPQLEKKTKSKVKENVKNSTTKKNECEVDEPESQDKKQVEETTSEDAKPLKEKTKDTKDEATPPEKPKSKKEEKTDGSLRDKTVECPKKDVVKKEKMNNTSSLENGSDESMTKKEKLDNKEKPQAGNKTENAKVKKKEPQQDIPPEMSPKSSPATSCYSPSDSEKKSKIKKSTREPTKPKTKGVLSKKGQTPFSSWKKYFFVLDGKLLMYYRSESDYKGLQGAKGSLDLAELQDVQSKKVGKAKSNYPFTICRKSQRNVNLASESEEDREKWVIAISQSQQSQRRISGSENILNSPQQSQTKEKEKKYSTMPAGAASPTSCPSEDSSSASDTENEKAPEDAPEEPVLIQPKKVARVGIGIPLDFGAVKLKKVDEVKKKEVNEESEPISSETEKESPQVFGVKLKKASVITKENKNETTNDNVNNEELTKRLIKAPNIPLGKSSLLSQAEIDTNRISPDTKRSNLVERKRSPSPNIPLSKGVQSVLVKSSEEQEDVSSTNVDKIDDISVHIAESKEIRYSDDVLCMHDASIEYVQVKEEISRQEENKLDSKETKNVEVIVDEKQKTASEILQVSVTVKEKSDEEQEYEEFDEEFLRSVEEIKHFGLTKQSTDNTDICKDASLPPKSSLPESENAQDVEKHPSKDVEDDRDKGSKTNSNNKKTSQINISSVEGKTSPLLNDDKSSLQSPFKLRSETNESTHSSGKTESDNIERKPRKVKISHPKQASSCDETKEEELTKEKKKKKKKSSFSKILPGKRTKELKHKTDSDESLTSGCKSKESTGSPGSKKQKVICTEKEIQSNPVIHDEKLERKQEGNPQISIQENAETECAPHVELRSNPSHISDEARCSNYSRSSNNSRDLDPPPLLPEKRGNRAKSPLHDIPQSNLPVQSAEQQVHEEDKEPEVGKKVDGMISQEQINAILTAKDNREKRKRSVSRNSGGLLGVPDNSMPISSGMVRAVDVESRRPSCYSITSTESDEPLPRTHFLGVDRLSSSSGSFKGQTKSDDSDIASDTQAAPSKSPEGSHDANATVVLRHESRLSDTLSAGARVSLTSPEFTVVEEDRLEILDQEKHSDMIKLKNEVQPEEEEQSDYFPVIGADTNVKLKPSVTSGKDSSLAGMRTSGIIGLKAYLEENQEEMTTTKSGISRLGHSVAIEKLKGESDEST